MADEITFTHGLQVKKGDNEFTPLQKTQTFDQDNLGGPTPGYVKLATSEESFTFPELVTLGWIKISNVDATNFFEWGFSTGVYGGRVEPGEVAYFRLKPGTTLFTKADTAEVDAKIEAFED